MFKGTVVRWFSCNNSHDCIMRNKNHNRSFKVWYVSTHTCATFIQRPLQFDATFITLSFIHCHTSTGKSFTDSHDLEQFSVDQDKNRKKWVVIACVRLLSLIVFLFVFFYQLFTGDQGWGIIRLSPVCRLFGGPWGHSRDSSKLGEKSLMFICVYNGELLTPCAPAAIMSAILSRLSLSLVGSEAYRSKMAYCRAHTCVPWRLATRL